MENVFANIANKKPIARDSHLPVANVEQVEMVDGLKYVSTEYFIFIQRLEYVFMRLTTRGNLMMMGSDLISNVYTELSANSSVSSIIMAFSDLSDIGDDEQDDLVKHLTQTYCRMRGKDFVRKFIQRGLKSKNLGKGIRSEVVVVSNPKFCLSIKSEGKKSVVTESLLFKRDEMDSLLALTCSKLSNLEISKLDDDNLFQETNDSNV